MITTGERSGTECHLVHHKSHMDCLEMESSLRRQTVRTMALPLTATGHVFIPRQDVPENRTCPSTVRNVLLSECQYNP
jgi:hypothetical protein